MRRRSYTRVGGKGVVLVADPTRGVDGGPLVGRGGWVWSMFCWDLRVSS